LEFDIDMGRTGAFVWMGALKRKRNLIWVEVEKSFGCLCLRGVRWKVRGCIFWSVVLEELYVSRRASFRFNLSSFSRERCFTVVHFVGVGMESSIWLQSRRAAKLVYLVHYLPVFLWHMSYRILGARLSFGGMAGRQARGEYHSLGRFSRRRYQVSGASGGVGARFGGICMLYRFFLSLQ
jgi:hypothetical protein